MSKEEFLKIQTCALKVNIHCEGCKQKVKKILQKIEGVYTTAIDSELGKVTVSGNVDPATLIKKLNKNGKFAEIWGGAAKPGGNSQIQMKNNLQAENAKGGNNKNPPMKGPPNAPPKVVLPLPQNPQNQQLQQMKGFQDLKNPQQMKGPANGKDQKSVKFNLQQQEEGLSDDEFDSDDDFDDYEDDDDDEFDDEIEAAPANKGKPVVGNSQQMANVMMKNMLNAQQQGMKGGPNGANANGNHAKKGAGGSGGGGAGNFPVQFNVGGGGGNGNDGGKKGGGGGGGNGNNSGGTQNQGGGKGGKSGVGPVQAGKNGSNVDGNPNKNASHGSGAGGGALNMNSFMGNGTKKVMGDGPPPGVLNMMSMNAAAAAGLMGPAMATPNPSTFPAAHFPPAAAEQVAGNPYLQQQQYAAMMMNMQRANGNERFQPMVYARPPPAVSYMPSSYPQPYPFYQPPPSHAERPDDYAMFSDENTQSCSIM